MPSPLPHTKKVRCELQTESGEPREAVNKSLVKGSGVEHGVPAFDKEHATVIPALLGGNPTSSLLVWLPVFHVGYSFSKTRGGWWNSSATMAASGPPGEAKSPPPLGTVNNAARCCPLTSAVLGAGQLYAFFSRRALPPVRAPRFCALDTPCTARDC
jgi:hypothetical protein